MTIESLTGLNNTPFMDAAWKASYKDIETLLIGGADVHERNALGMTALACLLASQVRTTKANLEKCLDALLARGSDINSRDVFGQTALWSAVLRGDYRGYTLCMYKGADAKIPNNENVFPIDIAFFAARFAECELNRRWTRSSSSELNPRHSPI